MPMASGGQTTFNPKGIDVDASYVYWTDTTQDSVYRADLDGSNPQVLVDLSTIPLSSNMSSSANPGGLEVTTTHIYWAEATRDSIYRANLNGSSPIVLIDIMNIPDSSVGTSHSPNDVKLDDTHIYWTDVPQNSVFRAEHSGANPTVLVDDANIPDVPAASATGNHLPQ